MRLTVRTLLAWIDGLLEPDDQAALGDKVQASSVAPALVTRMNEVIARPTLSAPAPVGRGLADDPNTAAEFLDNALSADRLEAFERVCVESDLHLADVAASHRLLAELFREPTAIEPLSPSASGRLLAAAAKRLDPLTAAGVAVSAGGAARSVEAARSRSRSRRAPVAAWVSAAAAAALLALLGGFFVWSISHTPPRPAPVDIAVAPASPAPPEPSPVAGEAGVDRRPPGDALEPPAPADTAAETVAPAGIDSSVAEPPPAPPVMTEPAPAAAAVAASTEPAPEPPQAAALNAPIAPSPAAPPVDQRVPSGDALAIVAAPIMAPPVPAASTQSPPGDAVAAGLLDSGFDAARIVRDGGPLLHRDATAGEAGWMLRPTEATQIDREDLLAPPWCHPTFVVAGLTIRLEPCSRAVLTLAADGTPWLEMVFGRAVVWGAAADARLGVIAGGLRGTLAGVMREPAGVELLLDRGPGRDAITSRRAALVAGMAEKVWRQAEGDAGPPLAGLAPEVLLPARAAITWSDVDPAAATIVPPAVEPAWMRSAGGRDRVERSAVEALAAALAHEGPAAIDERLHALAAHPRAENRMIAAATLALLGSYDELVTLLGAEESGAACLQEAQWTTLERMTVPLAIARGDNSAAALAEAFRAAGPPGKADALLAIARGFSDAELADGGAAALVDALGDGSLAVRRAAIRSLLAIVEPDQRHRTTYRADRPAALRDDGIAWWRGQLEQGRIRRGGVPRPPSAASRRERDDE